MSPAVADLVVMIVFGALIGAILKLSNSILGMDDSVKGRVDRTRRPLKLARMFTIESVLAQAEEGKNLGMTAPRSYKVAIVSLYGLIIMLIVVVRISPITMRWWPFLGSILGAYMLSELVFSRTRAASRKAKEHKGVGATPA